MAQGTEKMLMLIGEFKLVSFQICCQLVQSGVSVEGIHSGHRSLPGGHYYKSQRGLEMISVFHLTLAAAQRYSKWQKTCSRMALRVFPSHPLPCLTFERDRVKSKYQSADPIWSNFWRHTVDRKSKGLRVHQGQGHLLLRVHWRVQGHRKCQRCTVMNRAHIRDWIRVAGKKTLKAECSLLKPYLSDNVTRKGLRNDRWAGDYGQWRTTIKPDGLGGWGGGNGWGGGPLWSASKVQEA